MTENNNDYDVNYTVDDDDFDMSSEEDDTFDEHDYSPRNIQAQKGNLEKQGTQELLRHIDSDMLLTQAHRLSIAPTSGIISTNKTAEVTNNNNNNNNNNNINNNNNNNNANSSNNNNTAATVPTLNVNNDNNYNRTVPSPPKTKATNANVSPSRLDRAKRKEEALKKFENKNISSEDNNTKSGTKAIDDEENLLSVTTEMLQEEDIILEKAAEAQRLVSKATKMAKRANIAINTLQMVDKTGTLISFDELQENIDAALKVRRARKERERRKKASKLKSLPIGEFNVVDLSEILTRHPEEQMRFAFKLADLNGDGRVTKEEIKESVRKFQEDGEDTEEDWALKQFQKDLDTYFLSGGCNSDYVDEYHLEASKYANAAIGAPLSVSIEELIALQQWTDDISFYKKVFSNKFIDRLSKAFIGAAHETTHIALQPNAQWDENAKAPWLDKSIVSCSNELSVQDDVAANLNDTDFQTIHSLIKLIDILKSKCRNQNPDFIYSYLKEHFEKMDLTHATYLNSNDFKRVLGKNGHGLGLDDEDALKVLEAYCETDNRHPGHLFYLELCKSLKSLMVFLEDNNKQETLLEKIKECDNDMAFDQFINVSNNTYDQWDLFSAVLCCKAWVLLNYINNDEILSQMIAPDPSRLPVGGSKKQNRNSNQNNCNIPIYNPMEMRDPSTNKYSKEYQSTNFSNSLWKQQQNRDFIYIIEGIDNDDNTVGGLRMKTKTAEENDVCSDAIVWVRLLSYMYDNRAHLRKDCLTKKEHEKLVKLNRMNNMSRIGTKKLSKYEKQLKKEAALKKRKEREKARLLAKNPVTFVDRMETKLEETRRRKLKLKQAQDKKIKEDALQKRGASRPDTLGFLKRLQMNEELKEKKRQDKIKAEMLAYKNAGHRVSKAEKKMKNMSKSITKEKKELAKNAFLKYDRDQSGWIDAFELKVMVSDLGEPVSDLEAQRLVKKLDTNNDGTIGFDEFMEWYVCRCPACKYVMERDPIPGRNYRKFALTTKECVEWAENNNVLDFNGEGPSPSMLICGTCLDVYKREQFIKRLDESEQQRKEKRKMRDLEKLRRG